MKGDERGGTGRVTESMGHDGVGRHKMGWEWVLDLDGGTI